MPKVDPRDWQEQLAVAQETQEDLQLIAAYGTDDRARVAWYQKQEQEDYEALMREQALDYWDDLDRFAADLEEEQMGCYANEDDYIDYEMY